MRRGRPPGPHNSFQIIHPQVRRLTGASSRKLCPSCGYQAPKDKSGTEATGPTAQAPGTGTLTKFNHHDLSVLHPSSPGSPLFQPSGTHVFQKLQAFLRAQYPSYGFQEVLTPTIYKRSLWETSGHWSNYRDDMFAVNGRSPRSGQDLEKETCEDEEYGLKPMNCPGHCLLFKSSRRSYRELPIRYADFSPLHRNELSGALSGLTRLRRFHQDDGHIFCRREQIKEEIVRTLDFVQLVYQTLNLSDYKLRLGTRPENFMGFEDEWDIAETRLRMALDESGRSYEVNNGDGAFYGPKIDILLTGADGKDHQTATIQLDFQLPKRFALQYDTPQPNQKETPVLIHRAVLGSLERFTALLIESYSGKWPFWISPRQLIILTVGKNVDVRNRARDMARQLAFPDARSGPQALRARNFVVECDNSDQSIGRKIRDAKKKGYSFYAIVGERNLKQSPDKQTLDLSLSSHPKERDIQQVIRRFLQSQRPKTQSSYQAGDTATGPVDASLTIEQCQELMTEIDSKFL
ncbi:MAG: hypothetical protein Q9219_002880 [cf. Caloplaca sp. 3 TL-2023]